MEIIGPVILFAIYLLPTIIASNRSHPNVAPIAVINIFLGWTLLGWVVALAWSVSSHKDKFTT